MASSFPATFCDHFDLQISYSFIAFLKQAALKAVQKDLMTDPGIVGTSDLKMLVKGNPLMDTCSYQLLSHDYLEKSFSSMQTLLPLFFVVHFILSRLLYLAFSANLGLLCMPHPGMGPLF